MRDDWTDQPVTTLTEAPVVVPAPARTWLGFRFDRRVSLSDLLKLGVLAACLVAGGCRVISEAKQTQRDVIALENSVAKLTNDVIELKLKTAHIEGEIEAWKPAKLLVHREPARRTPPPILLGEVPHPANQIDAIGEIK